MRKKIRHYARCVIHLKEFRTYCKFRRFTMIPCASYMRNLRIARKAFSIEGAIVECGTWKGGMIAGIAEIYGNRRDYYLFDSFEGLPEADPIDGIAALEWQSTPTNPFYHDNCRASEHEAAEAMALAGVEIPHIVKGWFEKTLPNVEIQGGIALLRLDGDWYESTMQILNNLFFKVNSGGLLIIDDYYAWDGCSRAVHDFLSQNKRTERIETAGGVCFIRKRE